MIARHALFSFGSSMSACEDLILCTAMLKEIIDIYVRKKSNVYCCLLDASKAFDRVHYGKLFNVLLSRDIHPCIVRIIVNSHIRHILQFRSTGPVPLVL